MTIENLNEFNRELDNFAKDLPQKQYKPFIKKIANQVLAGIVQKTPVDTGRARGNWQTQINETSEDDVDNLDLTGDQTIDAGANVINEMDPFDTVNIFNNLDYILALEEGHSQAQAPNGMVMLTLEEVKQQFPD
jgi:hypothetical protein